MMAVKQEALPRHRQQTASDRALRRVRIRLAVLIVGLLVILLLVLGSAVYLTMSSALLQPVRQAVIARANIEEHQIIENGGLEEGDQFDDPEVNGVFLIRASPTLQVRGGSYSPFGTRLPDPAAARRTLRDLRPHFSTASTGNEDYLIYSAPVIGHHRVYGVVQTGASQRQYEDGVHSLLGVLIVVGGLGILGSALIGAVVVQDALRPIRYAFQQQRDFVADAAHELRTPLSILRTSAELGLATETVAEQQAALEQSLVQSNHLTRLVDDLSLLARADRGVLEVVHAPVELDRLVIETVDAIEPLAEEHDVHLQTDIHEPVRIGGDAGRLRQLLVLLLDNALKHTPGDGTVVVRLERHGHHAQLQVADSGPGIPPQDLKRIFDRFYRGESDRPGQRGTGLGLSIGRWIAEAHGGSIAAANSPHGGAVFTVTLPL